MRYFLSSNSIDGINLWVIDKEMYLDLDVVFYLDQEYFNIQKVFYI